MEPTRVAERLAKIEARILAACQRSGRDRAAVTLVGASKRQPEAALLAAWDAGLRVFGENRVQEAEEHQAVVPKSPDTEWHLIGPLQSNKARRAAEIFAVIHSVDRLKIATVLNDEAARRGRLLPVFLEVNLGAEASKAGFLPDELATATASLALLPHLQILGLMAIPPVEPTAEGSRPWFRALREHSVRLAGDARWAGRFGASLSMGMSDDFEVAIEEGATHVRVGTALFGARES